MTAEINKEAVAVILKDQSVKCSCYIRLVEIIGRRISFICGEVPDYPLPGEKIELLIGRRYKIIAQKERGSFSGDDLELLKETGEIVGKHIQ